MSTLNYNISQGFQTIKRRETHRLADGTLACVRDISDS